tara:strand:- start:112 stop:606 length:495 start_codon:yes stop_codon:yes gene_type:complete
MKKLLLLSVLALFISCANQNQKYETISNGFTSTEGEQVTMGSQESVDIFLKIDKAWMERDYDAIKSLVSEDAQFVNADGESFIGGQAFADYIEKDYQETVVQNGQDWGWTINYAFAVKPTNADRGEYVNARFTGNYIAEEWYQIKDGKLVSWHQTRRTPTPTTN